MFHNIYVIVTHKNVQIHSCGMQLALYVYNDDTKIDYLDKKISYSELNNKDSTINHLYKKGVTTGGSVRVLKLFKFTFWSVI